MSRLGSLENDFRLRTLHNNQEELIKYERALINRNNKKVRVQKVAPGKNSNFYPRLRRKYNKYGSKGKLTPAYFTEINGSKRPNPKLGMVRGRYETQRQCMYVPKAALMKMAKDLGIPGFRGAPYSMFWKGSDLWKSYTTQEICELIRNSYVSKRRTPIWGMTAYDDPSLKQAKKSLEFVAVRLRVPTVLKNGKSKSLLRLAKDINSKLKP